MGREAGLVMMDGYLLRDSAQNLTRNARRVLELAGEEPTPRAVIAIVKSLPHATSELTGDRWREGALSRSLLKAFERPKAAGEEADYRRLFDYFVEYLPTRPRDVIDLLEGAVLGVLCEFTY